MPHYVNNPENPGQHIDANELVRRNPLTPPPPDSRIVGGLLKRDTWTRREAIAILAGADTRHAREYFHGVPIPTGYLDGTTALSLQAAGLHHPLHEDISAACSMLDSYSEGQDMDEKRTPSEWLEWAKSKGFRPYWLVEPAPESAPAGEAATVAEPMQRQRYQEQEILRVLAENGYTATALPKPPKNNRLGGPKAIVRAALRYEGRVFDKAWERLRANGEIRDA